MGNKWSSKKGPDKKAHQDEERDTSQLYNFSSLREIFMNYSTRELQAYVDYYGTRQGRKINDLINYNESGESWETTTLLISAIKHSNRCKIVAYIVDVLGADVSFEVDGVTPLIALIKHYDGGNRQNNGYQAKLKYLASHKDVNINSKSSKGETPMDIALSMKQGPTMRTLVKYGAYINSLSSKQIQEYPELRELYKRLMICHLHKSGTYGFSKNIFIELTEFYS